jgi:hypothetical protein
MNEFKEFIAGIEAMDLVVSDDLTTSEKYQIGEVYSNVKSFLVDNNLVPSGDIASIESMSKPIETLSGVSSINALGHERIVALCQGCNVPEKYLQAATESVALCIHNYQNNYSPGEHFSSADNVSGDVSSLVDISSTLPEGSGLLLSNKAAIESFGSFADKTIVDAKIAITVSILKFHRGIMHRIVPVVPSDSNVITYKVTNAETYDLSKSSAASGETRFDGNHRIPFVDLYRNPSPANTETKPIILKTANDAAPPNNKLIAENIFKIGTDINLFDYTIDASVIGFQKVDFTDLVSEGAKLKTIYVEVTDGTDTEIIPLSVIGSAGSRFSMSANAMDSADRICNVSTPVVLDNATKKSDGTPSALFGGFTTDAAVVVDINAFGTMNLKSSNAVVNGNIKKTSLITKSGNAPASADNTLFGTFTFTMVGAELDAHFSEENVRKTTKALQLVSKQLGYEIPGSASVVVQYSQNQTKPEEVVDALAKLLAIGNDDRGVKVIEATLTHVFDRLKNEAVLTDRNYTGKVMNEFAAGQKVKPSVIMEGIVINSSVANMRSEEMWGDTRAVVEKALMEILIRIFNESMYVQELNPGEKPVFKVLTSGYILGALLSTPHYHDVLRDTAADAVNDGVVEFRRTLPNGVVLDIVTSTFDYLSDKMIIIPNRPSKPRDVLNFAQNVERGVFVAQSTPVVANSVFNQLVANSREFPIVTNPIGAIVQVSGVSNIFNGVNTLGV